MDFTVTTGASTSQRHSVWLCYNADNKQKYNKPQRIPDSILCVLLASTKYNWWTVATAVRAGWRCTTTALGAPCAMTTGTWWMPTWCASSWTAGSLSPWAAALTLAKAQVSSCWTTWTAEGMKRSSASATVWAGASTTVTTMRMWVLPAEVQKWHSCTSAEVAVNHLCTSLVEQKNWSSCFLFNYASRTCSGGAKRSRGSHHVVQRERWFT